VVSSGTLPTSERIVGWIDALLAVRPLNMYSNRFPVNA